MDDLLQEFIAETRETLEAISGEIVGWEANPTDRGRLDSIFRFVHTIKGSCGFLNLPRLARLSHAAEDVLSAVRAGERTPEPALVTAVLAIIDRISEIVEAIDSGAALDDSGEDLLLAALEQPREPAAAEPAPSNAAADAAATPDRPAEPRGGRRSVRLSVDLLDRMMGGVSDMVLARNQLARHVRDLDDLALTAMLERLSMTVAELRDTVTRTRMQRIDALFSPLPRIVRDTAGALGKTVALTVEGNDVELDREMIELLRDPLVHMVRNALDHGLETAADRLASGKPATGRLLVSARQAGNLIVVEIADDGRGIDTGRLVEKLSLAEPSRAPALATMEEARRAELIFEPGLSSRDQVTTMSGRGVGMDVVKANVEQIGGRITLQNRPGAGLTVTLEVPLTLAILNTVLVDTAGERFALPRQSVEEIVACDEATRIERFGDKALVTVRGRRLPLVDLGSLVGAAAERGGEAKFLVIVTLRDGAFALPLAGVIDTQELVVKPAAPAVMAAGIYAGHVLPDDGVPVLLLDCAGIAARAQLTFNTVAKVEQEQVAAPSQRALLIEDLDGARRALPVEAIDRIEAVTPDMLRLAAGILWLTIGDRAVRLWGSADRQSPDAIGSVLRLRADAAEIAYPVREVIDLIDLPTEVAPVPVQHGEAPIAGIAMVEGEPVELLDTLCLLEGVAAGRQPLCLLQGSEGAWMEAFLRPTIEAAGYRVVRALAPGEEASVALSMDDEPVDDAVAHGAIRLSRHRHGALYRYDRAALAAALSECRA